MSLAPSPTTAPSQMSRDVVLRRDRVVVAGEDDERALPCVAPYQSVSPSRHVGAPTATSHVRRDLRLVPALGRDVHELERAGGKPVGEGGHHGDKRGTIPEVTTRQNSSSGVEPERGLVLAVLPKSADAEQELGELRELARTAGVEPVAELVQQRASPDPRTYVGKGKLEELKQAYEAANAEVLIVDDELEPAQQKALENALTARVVDRTQLILDIFAQHAKSAEGKLQVELAQLEYNLPRMRGHVAAPRAPRRRHRRPRRRRRHARPGRVAARDRPADRAPQDLAAQAAPQGGRQAPRDAAEGARGQRHAHGGARRLHERRQVDAPERAHGLGGERREPALRDARPDDTRLRARRQALPRHRHRRLHPQAADAARRGLRVDARGDARRRPRAARRRRLRARRPARGDDRVRGHRARGDRCRRGPARARAEQDRPGRPARPQAARERVSRLAADLGGHRRGRRGAAGADRRALRRPLRGRPAAAALRGGRQAGRAVRARRADRRARG